MSWQNLILEVAGADASRLGELLEALGALSVTLLDAGDEPLLEPPPGATPLWQRTRVTALFAADRDIPALLAEADVRWRAMHGAGLPGARIEPLPDQEWMAAWRQHVRPLTFGGRLCVLPDDSADGETYAGPTVRLSGGLAFGTGNHPTTWLCLRWLARHAPVAKRVTDFGCGSGVLALAALALGARAALATDNDRQALEATRANADLNRVSGRLRVTSDPHLPPNGADVVLANVLAGPIRELAPAFDQHLAPDGELVLSGVLAEQVEAVRAAYAGFRFEVAVRDGWACLHGWRELATLSTP